MERAALAAVLFTHFMALSMSSSPQFALLAALHVGIQMDHALRPHFSHAVTAIAAARGLVLGHVVDALANHERLPLPGAFLLLKAAHSESQPAPSLRQQHDQEDYDRSGVNCSPFSTTPRPRWH